MILMAQGKHKKLTDGADDKYDEGNSF
jgi:hypothetical protein